jgi:hypothetical protein
VELVKASTLHKTSELDVRVEEKKIDVYRLLYCAFCFMDKGGEMVQRREQGDLRIK